MFACIDGIPNFSWPYRRHEEKKDHSSQPYEDPEMTFLLPPRDMITGAVAAISDPRGDLENGSHTLRKQEEQKTRGGALVPCRRQRVAYLCTSLCEEEINHLS